MTEPDNNHEITIEVSGDQVKIRAQDDAQENGRFVFEDLAKDTVDVFQNWLDLSKITSQKELQVLGSLLFQALFDEHTRPFLENALRQARNDKQRLRILISFSKESSDLYSLPWEYMYYHSNSGRSFFLSTQADLVLSRYIAQGSGRKSMAPSDRVLRTLVLVSQPDHPSLGPVVAEPVIEAIQKLAEKYPIQLVVEKKPTVPNLLENLKDLNPHIIHFIGHGRYNDELNQGEIALLANDETSLRPVRDTEFVEFLTQMNAIPKLFLLQMCEGGVVDFKKQFAGMAPQLILAGVDAVVAMQHPITNAAAIAFSRAFYKELAEGNPVDSAVQMGRWQITLEIPQAYDSRVFGTPVLYMHSRDGIILPPSEAGKKTGEASVSPQAAPPPVMESQSEPSGISAVPMSTGGGRIIQTAGIGGNIPVTAAQQSPASLRASTGKAALTSIPPRLQLSLRKTATQAGDEGGLSKEEISALVEKLPWKTLAPADFCTELDRLAQVEEGMASLVYQLMRDELNEWLQSNQ